MNNFVRNTKLPGLPFQVHGQFCMFLQNQEQSSPDQAYILLFISASI